MHNAIKCLACWVKISAEWHFEIFFPEHRLFKTYFLGKSKKNIISLSSAEFAKRVVKVNIVIYLFIYLFIHLFIYLFMLFLLIFSRKKGLIYFVQIVILRRQFA